MEKRVRSDLLAIFEAVMEEDIPSTPSTQQRLSIAVAKTYDDMLSEQ